MQSLLPICLLTAGYFLPHLEEAVKTATRPVQNRSVHMQFHYNIPRPWIQCIFCRKCPVLHRKIVQILRNMLLAFGDVENF